MSPSGGNTIPSGVDFPSQRRERIDWHKLASIDLHDLTSGCPIEMLQENLTQVAFCDAEAEFDLGTVAGQRNLLKMFRLSQLTVQYLFLSQDFMETQLKEAQEEVQQVSEKYQQVKAKLLQQVEEAKKMKATNRNMRETVKQINSFAIANGIFQALQCPQCPKTFRSPDFLQSHLWRKHPSQAASITLPQATPPVMTSTVSPAHVTLVPSSFTNHGPSASNPPLQTTHAPSAITEVKTHEPSPSSTTLPSSIPISAPAKVNDVDSYRLNEVERKCDTMSENLLHLFRELEEQKKTLEADHSRKQDEVKKAWEEKKSMEEYYEAQVEKLSRQVSQLQSSGVARVPTQSGDDELRDLVRRQEEEVKRLQEQIQSHATENRVEEIRNLDDVSGLSEELQELRSQLREQEVTHKKSLKEMKESLQKSYEKALSSEKDRLKDMMKDMAHREAAIAVIPHRPPPSPKANKSKKPPTPNLATKPSGIPHGRVSSPSVPQSQHPESKKEGRGMPQPHHRPTREVQSHRMDAEDTESESESKSETDTSYWNQSDLKVKHLHISASEVEKDKSHTTNNQSKKLSQLLNESSQESVEEEESQTESEISSESLRLEALLRDNPQLWGQMKGATSEVLASRLSSLGVDPSSRGIKTETLTACLSQLRKDRKALERKHGNFHDLRKRIENEVRMKVDDKIDNADADDSPDPYLSESVSDNKKRTSGMLSRMVKNVQSKVKERSKSLSSSVSKTGESMRSGVRDIFHTSSKSRDDVQVISDSHEKVTDASDDVSEKEESSEEEEESSVGSEVESNSARVEVHNETMKSVRRNLFSGDPGVASESGTHPKHPSGYFDNNTYGEEMEDDDSGTGWDSEPEYENMKEEPPKRSDSLHLSLDSADLHSTPRDIWQPAGKSQPIKVKQPSGEKVSDLTRTIEQQLSGRRKSKPMAGAVDIIKSFEVSSGSATRRGSTAQGSPISTQDLQSASESSNTIGTSMWGSAETVEKGVKQPPRPSTSRATVHSWDSEENLDISDLE